MKLSTIRKLVRPSKTKMVLLVLDGVGGMPIEGQATELESAVTPHLDTLAESSLCGLQQAVATGITPGSGAAHLALFGYDPVTYHVGAGVLAAIGLNFELKPTDLAVRGNLCTLDAGGNINDRYAGWVDRAKNEYISELLSQIRVSGVQVFSRPLNGSRLVLIFRGDGLSEEISDSDPQIVGQPPARVQAYVPEAQRTAVMINRFLERAREVLKNERPPRHLLLRGFSKVPYWPKFGELFGLRAAALSDYPIYRGLSHLIGMDLLDGGKTFGERLAAMNAHWTDYDFFFINVQQIERAAELGDFGQKVRLIEEVDIELPRLLGLKPDVLAVTGDHAAPAYMRSHSWHPVPIMISSRFCGPDSVDRFGERACMQGGLGANFPAVQLMPLMLANAMRLKRYGA
jgi:2,3-bisphosphoglycerate-independent phosphoglycerate mutase